MKFDNITKPYIKILRGRVRPFFAPVYREKKFDGHLTKTERGHRIIEVPILIKYEDRNHFRKLTEDMAEWLVHEEPKQLEFNDEPDRIYFALVDDTITEDFLYNESTEALLRFVSGYKYSKERKVTISTSTTEIIKGHKSTIWHTRTQFTTNKTGYDIKFNSPGKSNLREVGKIKINYNFVSGDVLEIDYAKRLVTLNGIDITNTVSILQSNFMELPIGDVEFTVSHKTEFYYHERYY